MLRTEKLKRFQIVENERFIVQCFESNEGHMISGTFFAKKCMYPNEHGGMTRLEVYDRYHERMEQLNYLESGFPLWVATIKNDSDPSFVLSIKPDHKLNDLERASMNNESAAYDVYAFSTLSELNDFVGDLAEDFRATVETFKNRQTDVVFTFSNKTVDEATLSEDGTFTIFHQMGVYNLFENRHPFLPEEWLHVKPQLLHAYHKAFVNVKTQISKKVEVLI